MKRRRLIVIVTAFVTIAAGVASWWWPRRLSAEEQKFVGLWRYTAQSDPNARLMEFTPDRRVRWRNTDQDDWVIAHWSLTGDKLAIDHELDPVGRAVRPIARYIGARINGVALNRVEWVTTDEMRIWLNWDNALSLTRAPAD
jgi:hypothetical protein